MPQRIPHVARGMEPKFARRYPEKTIELMTSKRQLKRGDLEVFFSFGSPRRLFATGRFDRCIRCDTMEQLLRPELANRHTLKTIEDVKNTFPKRVKNGKLIKPIYACLYTDVRLLDSPIPIGYRKGAQAYQGLTRAERAAVADLI